MDEGKLAAEEKKFAFDKDCAKKNDEQFEQTKTVGKRRLSSGEQQLDLDKVEREERMRKEKEKWKEAREKRKAILTS